MKSYHIDIRTVDESSVHFFRFVFIEIYHVDFRTIEQVEIMLNMSWLHLFIHALLIVIHEDNMSRLFLRKIFHHCFQVYNFSLVCQLVFLLEVRFSCS